MTDNGGLHVFDTFSYNQSKFVNINTLCGREPDQILMHMTGDITVALHVMHITAPDTVIIIGHIIMSLLGDWSLGRHSGNYVTLRHFCFSEL